jgi:predicted ATPase
MARRRPSASQPEALAGIVLERYRVFRARTEIPVAPLTLLAGANSSGKSSAMHGLLLLKQTLESAFDPGALLLSGDHVSLASFDEARSRGASGPIVLGVRTTRGQWLEAAYQRNDKGEIDVVSQRSQGRRGAVAELHAGRRWHARPVRRFRCLLGLGTRRGEAVTMAPSAGLAVGTFERMLHVPGLRSPPRRDYPATAVGERFPGRFEPYVASVLHGWQERRDPRLGHVTSDLLALGLTWKVRATKKSDTELAIEVGRQREATRGGAHDLVAIADVGVGVSQVLPVLVALHCAAPGQLVYLEQPELHLHPRAQYQLAPILARAAARGVRVVAETHSSLLLLGVQVHVLDGSGSSGPRLRPRDVQLNWFSRDARGDAQVTSARLDEDAAFGDWPQDFDDVDLAAQKAYLDAIEKRSAR